MFNLTKTEVLNCFINDFLSHNFQNAVTVGGYDISSHRYRSWEICRKAFEPYKEIGLPPDSKSKDDVVDYLALQLAFYLASWGMYRGSSFLLYLDYTVHKPVIEILLNDTYRPLFKSDDLISAHVDLIKSGETDKVNKSQYITLLFGENGKGGITKELTDYYAKWRTSVDQKRVEPNSDLFFGEAKTSSNLSAVLVTKILMGVYGCIPAYDRYVCSGLKTQGICQTYNKSGVLDLLQKMEKNNLPANLAIVRAEIKASHSTHSYDIDSYTYMKLMDMVLWGIGGGGIVVFKKEKNPQATVINNTTYRAVFDQLKEQHNSLYTLHTANGTYTSNNLEAIFNCVLTEDLKITDKTLLEEIAKLEYNRDGDISQNYMKILDKTK